MRQLEVMITVKRAKLKLKQQQQQALQQQTISASTDSGRRPVKPLGSRPMVPRDIITFELQQNKQSAEDFVAEQYALQAAEATNVHEPADSIDSCCCSRRQGWPLQLV